MHFIFNLFIYFITSSGIFMISNCISYYLLWNYTKIPHMGLIQSTLYINTQREHIAHLLQYLYAYGLYIAVLLVYMVYKIQTNTLVYGRSGSEEGFEDYRFNNSKGIIIYYSTRAHTCICSVYYVYIIHEYNICIVGIISYTWARKWYISFFFFNIVWNLLFFINYNISCQQSSAGGAVFRIVLSFPHRNKLAILLWCT